MLLRIEINHKLSNYFIHSEKAELINLSGHHLIVNIINDNNLELWRLSPKVIVTDLLSHNYILNTEENKITGFASISRLK